MMSTGFQVKGGFFLGFPFHSMNFFRGVVYSPSLKLTAKVPENCWLEDDSFPFGMA